MNSEEKIDVILQNLGFQDYKWIDPKKIVVSQWVRVKCQFGCSDYGLGTCPPNTPSVDECRKFFNEYNRAVILRFTVLADRDKYPSQWSKSTTSQLLKAEKEIFTSDYPKVFLLNQTCCSSCKECPGNRKDCKDKEKSRPSPEGFAVDVYQTVKNAGWDIHVIPSSPSDINRIAIIMVD